DADRGRVDRRAELEHDRRERVGQDAVRQPLDRGGRRRLVRLARRDDGGDESPQRPERAEQASGDEHRLAARSRGEEREAHRKKVPLACTRKLRTASPFASSSALPGNSTAPSRSAAKCSKRRYW